LQPVPGLRGVCRRCGRWCGRSIVRWAS
jgi:hypothetical protein